MQLKMLLRKLKPIKKDLLSNPPAIAVLLFFITLTVYMISPQGNGKYWNYFVLLADAFLHGRLYLLDNPPWLNELVTWQGHYYVVLPPMPALLLLPFVAFLGTSFPQPVLSILIGSANVALSYIVFLNLLKKQHIALWMAILYGFGTIQWFHAQVGSAWYFAHIVTLFFLWLALRELVTSRRLLLVGFWIGCAFLSRLPTIFAVLFVIVYCREQFFKRWIPNVKAFMLLGLGLAPLVILNFLYNYLRFGTIKDIGYTLLPIFDEPWYRYGLISIQYIPIHLKEIFTALPKLQPHWPYVIPSQFAMAIWFTTPAFVLIPFARFRTKLALASLAGLVAVALPSLMHGGNGFTQFGYRHTLDYMPFLLLLTALGMRGKVTGWTKLLVVASIVVNTWGVIMISFLNIWTF